MFRTLTLRTKILALPCVAAIGFLVTLGVTIALNSTAKTELALIQREYSPALEMSRRLQSTLDAYQRSLRDAVGVSDTAAIAAADSLVDAFLTVTTKLGENHTVDTTALNAIADDFESYRQAARTNALRMITGTSTDLLGGTSIVKAKLEALSQALARQTAASETHIANAFEKAVAVQNTVGFVTTSVLVVSLIALGLIAFGMFRSIVGAVKALSRAANEIAHGRIEQTIAVETADEIGELATAFRGMVDYIGNIAHAADRLAAGDLSAHVSPRSEHDVLSRNINRATATLQGIIGEAKLLIEAARNGELNRRGNPDKFEGAYAELIDDTNAMLDAVVQPISEAQDVLARVANRDLTARVEGTYLGDHAAMKQSLNTTLANIAEVFASLTTAISQVNAAASEIGAGSQDLANGAGDQAGAIDRVSQRIGVVDERTKANAADANEARAAMERAHTDTEQGVERMEALAAAVDEIKRSADSTAKIVKTIDEIAFQTNLLALNAAVEAARAGDAGKGFAVVADEVRSLAIRASEASRNTAALIEESVLKAEAGVKLNESVRRRLEEIRGGVRRAATMMSNIAESALEQEKELAEVTTAMAKISTLTQRTAANAEESASAAAELSAQAGEMHELATQYVLRERRQRRAEGASIRNRRIVRVGEDDGERAGVDVPPVPTRRKRAPRVRDAATAESAGASPAAAASRGSQSTAANDDVFPVNAAAVIPFDEDANTDVLESF